MVFEGLVSDVLSRVLGEYVKNLNKDQLKIGIFGGNVSLTNLELKEDALANLPINLPVQVKKGYLGRLDLKVPWKDLKSKPVIVQIDQIFALAVPQSQSYKYDEAEEQKKALELKRKKLDNYEWIKSLREAEDTDGTAADGKDKDNFTSRLVTKIIDNLQIVINKVHIRFENKNSLGRMYSIGVTLDKISAQSCDDRWIPSFIDSSKSQVIRKLAEMSSLGLYIDDSNESFQDLSTHEFAQKFLEIIPDQKTHELLLKTFVVKPISSQLKVTINKNEIIDKQIPRIISDCIFSQITVSLASAQYRAVLHVLEFTNEYLRDIKYLKYRPTTSVHSSPRAWWRYVIQVNIDQIRQKRYKRSWAYLLERRRDRIQYISLFKRSLPKVTWLTPLSKQESTQLQQLEDKLVFEDIIYFRSLAYAEIKKETEKNKIRKDFLETKKNERGFFTNLFGTAKKKEDEKSAPIVQLSTEERDELYKTIEYTDVVQMVEEPPDWVKLIANLEIKGIRLQLVEYDNVFIEAAYTGLTVKLEQRNEGVRVSAGIKLFEVYDQLTRKTQPTKVIYSIPSKGSGTFASAIVDTCPPEKNMDLFIKLNMDPLYVIITKPLIFKCIDFFHDPNIDITNISNRAGNHIVNITERAKVQLQDALDNHKTMGLFVNIYAPIIVLPEVVSSSPDVKSNALVVDLGNLKISSDLTNANIKGKVVGSISNENDFYDKFLVSLESVHVLVTDELPSVINDNHLKKEENHIIQKFDINLKIFSSIQQDNLTMTKLKVEGELPRFNINLSTKKIKQLISIADSVNNDITARSRMKTTISPTSSPALPSTAPGTTNNASGATSPSARTSIKMVDALSNSVLSSTGEGGKQDEEQMKILIAHKQLEAKFVLKSINLQLSNDTSSLVTLSLTDISVSFVQRTFDSCGHFEMGALEIHDNYTKNSIKKLATSNPLEDLCNHMTSPNPGFKRQDSSMVTVEFTQTNPDSPNYQKKDMVANVIIQNFYFVINPSTIYQILVMLKSLEPPKPLPNSYAEGLEANKKLVSSSVTTREYTSPDGQVRQKKVLRTLRFQVPKKKPPNEHITFQLQLEISSLGLALNQDNDSLLGILSINGFTTTVTNYKDTRLIVKGGLNSILVQDNTPSASKSKYKYVIKPSTEQGNMVEFQFRTHPTTLQDYQGYESSVQANVKSILVHANLPFLLTLQDYFLGGTFEPVLNPNFKVPGASVKTPSQSPSILYTSGSNPPSPYTLSPTSSPVLQSQPTTTSPPTTAASNNPITRTKLNIDVETPVLVIPQAMHSDNKIKLELGRVIISNSFSEHPKARLPMDNMKIELKDTNISIEHCDYGNSHFLEKLCIEINLSRTLQQPNTNPDIEDLNMSLIIPKLSFQLNESQYKFFLAMADSLTAQMEDTKTHINEIQSIRSPIMIKQDPNSTENQPLSTGDTAVPNEYDLQYFTEKEVIAGIGKTVSRINVQLDLFSFGIWNGIDGEIAHFTIKDTSVEVCNTSSNKTKIQVQMKSIHLTDTRKSSNNIYKSILKNSTHKPLPFIQLGYIRDNLLGDQYINVDVNNINLFLSPTPLFLIADFFMKPISEKGSTSSKEDFDLGIDDIESQLNDSDDEGPSNIPSKPIKSSVGKSKGVQLAGSLTSETGAPIIKSPSSDNIFKQQTRVPSITVAARMNPNVTLVENETKVTRCLIFKTKVDFKFKRFPTAIESADVLITNTKINIYRPVQNLSPTQTTSSINSSIDFSKVYDASLVDSHQQGARPIQILKPIERIQIRYSKQNLSTFNDWQQDISVDSTACKLFFSYDDVTTITNIANHILEQQKQLTALPASSLSSSSQSTNQSSSMSEISASSFSMRQLPHLQNNEQTFSQNEKLVFNCPVVSVLFINESPQIYIPLAEFFCSDVVAHVLNWSKDIEVKTHMTLKADYFNEINMKFEPLIEDWQFRVDLKKSASGRIRGSFMATQDILNVNISYGLIQTVSSTLSLIQSKEQSGEGNPSLAPQIFIAPTILSKHLTGDEDYQSMPSGLKESNSSISSSINNNLNNSGGKIQFHSHWISNETGIKFEYTLPKYENSSVTLDAHHGLVPVPVKLSKNRDSTIGDHLNLNLTLPNIATIENISLDSVGYKIYQLKPVKEASNLPFHDLLCDIRLRPDGSKVIFLKSLFEFENNTSMPFQLKFDEKNIISVEKNGRFSLPISLADQFKNFSFKLPESTQWSDPVDIKSLMATPTSKIFKLWEQQPNKFLFISLYAEKKCYNMSSTVSKSLVVFKFHPPISIENLLPVPFTIQLSTGNSNKVDLGVGDTLDIYHYAPGTTLAANISNLEGFPETKSNLFSGDWTSPSIAKNFKLTSPNSPRELVLDIESNQEISGIYTISIYCQYWLVNNTFLPLQVKLGSHDSLFLPINEPGKDLYSPTLFSSTSLKIKVSTNSKDEPIAPNEKKKKRYSQKFPIVTVGNANSIYVPNPVSGGTYEFACKVEFCKNSRFGLSKVVTFSPRHIICNSLPHPVLVAQYVDEKDRQSFRDLRSGRTGEIRLEAGETKPFHWMSPSSKYDNKISFKPIADQNQPDKYNYTGGFFIDSVTDLVVKSRVSADPIHSLLYHVNIQDKNGLLFVTIPPALNDTNSAPPILIENDTQFNISFHQKGQEQHRDYIPSMTKMSYGWDDPSGEYILQAYVNNDKPFKKGINVNKIKGYHQTIDKFEIYITVTIEDGSRLIQFSTNDRKYKKMKKLEENSLISSQDSSEYHLFIRLKGIGVSIIDQTPAELAYISLTEFFLQLTQSKAENTMELKLADFQIDNQLVKTDFPVILSNRKTEKTEGKDFLHVSIVKSTVNNIDYFRYFSILIQEMDIQFEDHWLKVLMDFYYSLPGFTTTNPNSSRDLSSSSTSLSQSISSTISTVKMNDLYNPIDLTPPSQDSSSLKMLYFVLVVLNPIKLNLTLALQNDGLFQTNHKILSSVEGLGFSLTKLDRAPITLNGLIMEHPFSSRTTFIDKVTSSYTMQILKQFYNILGSIDAIGNPAGLFRNFGTGVHDFFVEPAQGIVKSPSDFGKGLAKGTSSLVKNSVYGTFNSISKLTSTIGTGVAQLSFDDQYLNERKIQQARKPKHIGEGLAMGGVGLGRGILQGITGIVTKPVEGAKKGGFAGLAKGLVQGVVGVAVKPATAVIDLTTKATEGIKNTTNLHSDIDRVRPPRCFSSDNVLSSFEFNQSEGWFLLKTSHKGKHANENYIYHSVINPDQTIILSDQSLILIKNKKNLLHSTFIYRIPYSCIQKVQMVEYKGLGLELDPPQTLSLLERDQKRTTIGIFDQNINELVYLKLSSSVTSFKKNNAQQQK